MPDCWAAYSVDELVQHSNFNFRKVTSKNVHDSKQTENGIVISF